MTKRLEDEWIEYQNTLIPPDTSYLELREIRRAFYAGSLCILRILSGSLSVGDTFEMENLMQIELLNRELRDFTEKVDAGLA